MEKKFRHLTSPFRIKSHTYKNRILTSPVSQPFYSVNGCLSAQAHAYLVDQAKGGAAQITLGELPVDPKLGMGKEFDVLSPELRKDVEISLASFVLDVHSHGALVSMELGHAGEGIDISAELGCTYGPMGYVKQNGTIVKALDENTMDMVCEQFAFAAGRLKYLGFDGAVIHCAHGCLLAQFLSERTNKRNDEFGGCFENRARFPIMVLERIRSAVGENFIIELRISGTEGIEGGIEVEDNIRFCRMLNGLADIIHVSAGIYSDPRLFVRTHPVIYYPNGCNARLASQIKAHTDIPVAVVGAINSPELAEKIIAEGMADFVALGRQTIADPYFARKCALNEPEEITPCIRCLNCMDISSGTGMNLQCSVNPRAGRSARYPVEYPKTDKGGKICVIGGGPAGLKAAITAKKRGFDVVLFEKESELGGTIKFADTDVFKYDLKRFKDSLIALAGSSGVDIRLGVEASPKLVEKECPDAVIAAVGSCAIKLPIPGIDGENVVHGLDVYSSPEKLGDRIVMVGGGLVGCEVGIHLAAKGHKVTIVEMSNTLASDCNSPHRIGLMLKIDELVTAKTGMCCRIISDNGVYCTDNDGNEHFFESDTVVYALGMKENYELAESFRDSALRFYNVGDSAKVGKVLGAVSSGYFAALDL